MSIDMFDFEWYRTKNKSKELTLGWLYNNGIQNDFAKGYTKNVTDYLSVEWSFYFEKQFASDTIEDLCKQAYDNGMAPPVFLDSTHIDTLKFIDLNILKQFTLN